MLLPFNQAADEPNAPWQPEKPRDWLDALRGVAALIVVSNPVVETTESLAPDQSAQRGTRRGFLFPPQRIRVGPCLYPTAGGRNVRRYLYEDPAGATVSAVPFGTVMGILIAVISLTVLHRKENFVSARDLLEAAALALVMLPSFGLSFQGLIFPFNAQAWSLFFELLVNIPFAPAAGLLRIVIVLGIAVLVDRYLDRPLQRWLKASGPGPLP